jgi:hypothetical protein
MFACCVCCAFAFVSQQQSSIIITTLVRKNRRHSQCCFGARDAATIRSDIERMRAEATLRLQRLQSQLDTVRQETNGQNNSKNQTEQQSLTKQQDENSNNNVNNKNNNTNSKIKLQLLQQGETQQDNVDQLFTSSADTTTTSATTPYTLLDNTRWKLAFSIGRETNTWMPNDWGKSGDRFNFQVLVDFTSEPLLETTDEFLQQCSCSSSVAKQLVVRDAWSAPTGAQGRKVMSCIQCTGGYAVLPGQGPMGTDLLRLYMELIDDARYPGTDSDVYCPAGRVYATCGYFAMPTMNTTARAIGGCNRQQQSVKERAQQEYQAIVQQYKTLELELERDERPWLVSVFNHLERRRDLFQLRRAMRAAAKQVHEARQQDPERSQLRQSRDGRVGLTKDGGVCRKVFKQYAMEYHILGRMTLTSVEATDDHHNDDTYQELVHELHP